mgnify:CR=1 FL=1
MSDVLPQLLLVVVLIVINAAFAGTELALVSLRESQLQRLEQRSSTGALLARLQLDHPDHVDTLATVPVPGRYVEPGVDKRSVRPVPRLDAVDEAYTVLHRLIVDPAHRIERRFQGGYFRAARSVLEQ